MSKVEATVITEDPIVCVLGEMALNHEGVMEMARGVQRYRPQCVPEGGFSEVLDLVPHDGWDVDPSAKAFNETEASVTRWPDGQGAAWTERRRKVTDNLSLIHISEPTRLLSIS